MVGLADLYMPVNVHTSIHIHYPVGFCQTTRLSTVIQLAWEMQPFQGWVLALWEPRSITTRSPSSRSWALQSQCCSYCLGMSLPQGGSKIIFSCTPGTGYGSCSSLVLWAPQTPSWQIAVLPHSMWFESLRHKRKSAPWLSLRQFCPGSSQTSFILVLGVVHSYVFSTVLHSGPALSGALWGTPCSFSGHSNWFSTAGSGVLPWHEPLIHI